MIKNMIKRKINKTRRLALALALPFSCFLYRIIESKTSPKITTTIINNIKNKAIYILFNF